VDVFKDARCSRLNSSMNVTGLFYELFGRLGYSGRPPPTLAATFRKRFGESAEEVARAVEVSSRICRVTDGARSPRGHGHVPELFAGRHARQDIRSSQRPYPVLMASKNTPRPRSRENSMDAGRRAHQQRFFMTCLPDARVTRTRGESGGGRHPRVSTAPSRSARPRGPAAYHAPPIKGMSACHPCRCSFAGLMSDCERTAARGGQAGTCP